MMIDVTLRVSGIDLDDETTDEILGNHFADLLWQGEGKLMKVMFAVNEHAAPAEVLERVRALQAKFPDFHALGTDRDLVSTTEIASRVGVSREAARKWSKEQDFPAPSSAIGKMHVWLWCDVLVWLDKSRGIEMDENPPSEAMLVQIDNCLMGNPDATSIRWQQVSMPKKEVTAVVRERRTVTPWPETTQSGALRVEVETGLSYLLKVG